MLRKLEIELIISAGNKVFGEGGEPSPSARGSRRFGLVVRVAVCPYLAVGTDLSMLWLPPSPPLSADISPSPKLLAETRCGNPPYAVPSERGSTAWWRNLNYFMR